MSFFGVHALFTVITLITLGAIVETFKSEELLECTSQPTHLTPDPSVDELTDLFVKIYDGVQNDCYDRESCDYFLVRYNLRQVGMANQWRTYLNLLIVSLLSEDKIAIVDSPYWISKFYRAKNPFLEPFLFLNEPETFNETCIIENRKARVGMWSKYFGFKGSGSFLDDLRGRMGKSKEDEYNKMMNIMSSPPEKNHRYDCRTNYMDFESYIPPLRFNWWSSKDNLDWLERNGILETKSSKPLRPFILPFPEIGIHSTVYGKLFDSLFVMKEEYLEILEDFWSVHKSIEDEDTILISVHLRSFEMNSDFWTETEKKLCDSCISKIIKEKILSFEEIQTERKKKKTIVYFAGTLEGPDWGYIGTDVLSYFKSEGYFDELEKLGSENEIAFLSQVDLLEFVKKRYFLLRGNNDVKMKEVVDTLEWEFLSWGDYFFITKYSTFSWSVVGRSGGSESFPPYLILCDDYPNNNENCKCERTFPNVKFESVEEVSGLTVIGPEKEFAFVEFDDFS